MPLINLLEETIQDIHDHGKHIEDVIWVGNNSKKCTWKQFEEMANFEYGDALGAEEVIRGVYVVGKNWWLERHSYDNSEWWEFKTLPKMPLDNTFNIMDLWEALPEYNPDYIRCRAVREFLRAARNKDKKE